MDTEAYLATIKAKLVSSAIVRAIDIVQEYVMLARLVLLSRADY